MRTEKMNAQSSRQVSKGKWEAAIMTDCKIQNVKATVIEGYDRLSLEHIKENVYYVKASDKILRKRYDYILLIWLTADIRERLSARVAT